MSSTLLRSFLDDLAQQALAQGLIRRRLPRRPGSADRRTHRASLVRPARQSAAINQDCPQLFDPSPAWSAQTDVFVISPLMGSVVGPGDALQKTNAFLAAHHIALAVGIGAAQMDNADRTPGECGFGVEGLNRPGRNAAGFKRLKAHRG